MNSTDKFESWEPLSLNEVREAVEKIVNSNPYNSPNCRYIDETSGAPVCIVGHYLVGVGVSVDYLKTRNTIKFSTLERWSNGHLPDFQESARKFLEILQYNQDFGHNWSDSYHAALRLEEL